MRPWGSVFRALGSNLISSARAVPVGPSLVVLALLIVAAPAAAQPYTVLHSFPVGQPNASSLVQGSDGNFYGTTVDGGASGYGTVFKITPGAVLTTLYAFAGSDGKYPYAALVQGTDGNFYGTTYQGGASNYGTVFEITPAGVLTTLYSFAGSDGKYPYAVAPLVQGTDGNFYGTTNSGGTSGSGTVFKITPAGMLTTLYSFAGSDGAGPNGLVQGTDGNLYGTTSGGGASGKGTVFKITPAGVLTTLHSFAGSDGDSPRVALAQGTDGNFYGTTYWGGATDNGSVFKITPAGGLTRLYSFAELRANSASPNGLVQGADGNFYGTTFYAGGTYPYDYGTVFKITPAGVLTTLHDFGDGGGWHPNAALVQATDGNFYGTTDRAGANGYGTVFKITPAGVLTTFYSFAGGEGTGPGGLVQGTDGDFYGMTAAGGTSGSGTFFKITPAGVLTTLYSFPLSNRGGPRGALVQGTDGNFYGSSNSGGGWGTVFKITPAGVLTTLHTFAENDGASPNGLVQGTDGNFYGTTTSGGTNHAGTVFKITPAGELTTLHIFANSDGAMPYAALVQGTDGNFYGTTSVAGAGGTSTYGTVFKITPAGVLTTLHNFTGSDGRYPYAGLVQGSDGNFYGTTSLGGTSVPDGTVFKITPEGVLTTLHNFAWSDGSGPGGLVQGTDGNFYGGTGGGGASGKGTIFKITPVGVLTTLHNSTGSDGRGGGLVQATDGNFYGTSGGGLYGGGVFFRLTLGQGYYTVTPCRVVDTRDPTDPHGGPSLAAGAGRTFIVAGQCGIPATATAVALNVVVVSPTTGPGHLTIYPGGAALSETSTINYVQGDIRANNAIVPLGANGDIAVYCAQGSGTADLVVDVFGYFQ